MHTRRTASACQQAPLPALPAELQHCILASLIDEYCEPSANSREYELYPYKTTLAWLLSLGTVCRGWRAHLCDSAVLCRRIRQERLIKVVMAHDYVHHIQSTTPKATRARKYLPASVQLPFQPGTPSLQLTVRKQLSKREQSGLPATALMLAVDGYQLIERQLLQPLLEDAAVLDQHYNAAFVLKVCTDHMQRHKQKHKQQQVHRQQVDVSGQQARQQGQQLQTQQQQHDQHEPIDALPAHATSAAGAICQDATQAQHAMMSSELVTNISSAIAAMPQWLAQAVAMEVSEASAAVYFIPTIAGFRRRVPWAAAAQQ